MRLILLFFVPFIIYAQSGLVKTAVIPGKVEISVPKELSRITAEMWNFKYQNRPQPAFVLSDNDGEINLIIDKVNQPVSESQIPAFKDFQISQLKKRILN